jgi:hypothetical protein
MRYMNAKTNDSGQLFFSKWIYGTKSPVNFLTKTSEILRKPSLGP